MPEVLAKGPLLEAEDRPRRGRAGATSLIVVARMSPRQRRGDRDQYPKGKEAISRTNPCSCQRNAYN